MKKLAVLLVVLGAGVLAAIALLSPERRACSKMVELCGGGGDQSKAYAECREGFAKLSKSNPEEAPKLAQCINDSNTCGAVVGCQAGTAFNLGAAGVKGLFDGLGRSLSGNNK